MKRLAPGVTLTQEIDSSPPLVINVLSVDLTAPGVRLGVGIGQDQIAGPRGGRESVSGVARRHGALAAVNADFFPFTGDPLGVGIRDGELFSEPWTGKATGRGGPRSVLGVSEATHQVLFDNLSFLGDLQAADGERALLNGINRAVGKNEIVAFTTTYGERTANKRGGTEVVVEDVNLPVRANKMMLGQIRHVATEIETPEAIPADCVVLSGGPGSGADFLARHCHAGDKIGFVLGVARPEDARSAIQVASLPREAGDLPSRAGAEVNRNAYLWAEVQQAVGGGPRLLSRGQIDVDAVAEGFDAGFSDDRHARTAVGASEDGHHLLLITVDGQQAISKGVSLVEMARILKRYGATEGMNLDGGGSTTMVVDGLVVNSPSEEGVERRVADMLLVYSDQPVQPIYTGTEKSVGGQTAPADSEADQEGDDAPAGSAPPSGAVRLEMPGGSVRVGSATPVLVREGEHVIPADSSELLWQGPASHGVGFVSQKGDLVAAKPGAGVISALYKGQLLTLPVTVASSGSLVLHDALSASWSADPSGAVNHSVLTIRILDQYGMPRQGAPIHLTVENGAADRSDVKTNDDGDVTVRITWQSDVGGSVLLTSGALAPLAVPRSH